MPPDHDLCFCLSGRGFESAASNPLGRGSVTFGPDAGVQQIYISKFEAKYIFGKISTNEYL